MRKHIEAFFKKSINKFKTIGINPMIACVLLLLALPLVIVLTQKRLRTTSEAATSTANQWTISDDGAFVTTENPLLKLRFAYNAKNTQGWFTGTGTGQGAGGGGRDGAIVELYYKPTSTTNNLVFRNGTWGGTYDAFDEWEAENTAVDQASFNSPDTSSNRDGTVVAHNVRESAGRLFADFTVNFAAWQIIRHYIIYPDGEITVSADLQVVNAGAWNYIGHRFNFAGSLYSFTNNGTTYNWGTDWQNTSSKYDSWTDGVNRYSGAATSYSPTYGECDQTIRANAQTNIIANGTSGQCENGMTSRDDAFSGFLIKGLGTSPSVMVMQGAKDDWDGPFSQIPRQVALNPNSLSTDYRSYIETALFSFNWAPNNETQVGTTWFYMTTPGTSPDGDIWNKRGYWATNLGTWTEALHFTIDPNLQTADYLPRWQERARDLSLETPTNLIGATGVVLGKYDQRYHITAATGATQVGFTYKRASDNPTGRSINYGTKFLIDNIDQPTQVLVNGTASTIPVYYDPTARTALIELNVTQPAAATAYTISLLTANSTPTPTLVASQYQQIVLGDNPISYYRLGETSGTIAQDTKGINPGIYTNNPTLGVTGLIAGDTNTAVNFTGSNDVSIPGSASLNFTSPFSLEAWIKPSTIPASGSFASIITKTNAYSLQFNGPQIEFTVIQGGVRKRCQAPTGSIVAGQTYHTVGTFDGTTQRLYINGQQVASLATSGSTDVTSNNLYIGTWDGTSEYFSGIIDEAALYNTALTPTSVQTHYYAGVVMSTTTPALTSTPTPTPILDTTPPTITITSPLNGTTVNTASTITISASASDNVGVTEVDFLVNGTLLCRDTTAPYSCNWTVPGTNNIIYTITAQAYDAAGNASSQSVQVTAMKRKKISVSG